MRVLGIFAKHPRPGHVKTRLAATYGEVDAAALYAAFVEDICRRMAGTATQQVLVYSPRAESATDWAHRTVGSTGTARPQADGNLGNRLQTFFDEARDEGAEATVVVGSDSPDMPTRRVQQAFTALETHDVVLGPSTDGGYYLIGQGRGSHALFDEIDWSSPRVFRQTIGHVERLGLRLALLPVWYDVDTDAELRLLHDMLRASEMGEAGHDLARTAEQLKRICGP